MLWECFFYNLDTKTGQSGKGGDYSFNRDGSGQSMFMLDWPSQNPG